MIKSKQDFILYREADRIALGKPPYTIFVHVREILNKDYIWRFERLLRKSEYYKNVASKKSIIGKCRYVLIKRKFKELSLRLGFSIPENVFGPGLAILHYGTIVINQRAKIGANCRIHVCTNIGESGGVAGAPVIGNNVYIGPGAKIFGAISIADNCAIAANAAVNRSVEEQGMMIAGVPARIVQRIDIKNIIKHL